MSKRRRMPDKQLYGFEAKIAMLVEAINRQRDLGRYLNEAGIELPTATLEQIELNYATVLANLVELKQITVNEMQDAKKQHPPNMTDIYEQLGSAAELAESLYKIVKTVEAQLEVVGDVSIKPKEERSEPDETRSSAD